MIHIPIYCISEVALAKYQKTADDKWLTFMIYLTTYPDTANLFSVTT